MKKKGFTLIELLAVIVILAIIALIAIPLIGNVIEKAKIGALENSVNGLVESANMYYANQSIKGEQATETIFDFANGEQTSTSKLEYKGKVYNGKLILHANGEVAVCIDDKEHYAYKNKDTDEIVSGIGTCVYDGTTGDFSSNSPVEDIKKQVAAATATSDKVLEGSTIYTLSGLVAGTMANKSGATIEATTVTENGENTLINIPQAGYYNTNSKISVPNSVLNSNLNNLLDNQSTAKLIGYYESKPIYRISFTGTLSNELTTSIPLNFPTLPIRPLKTNIYIAIDSSDGYATWVDINGYVNDTMFGRTVFYGGSKSKIALQVGSAYYGKTYFGDIDVICSI